MTRESSQQYQKRTSKVQIYGDMILFLPFFMIYIHIDQW